MTFRADTFAQAKEKAMTFQRQEQYENGHGGYSGHLGTAGVGVQRVLQTFATREAAEEWILDNHKKWDVPMLARIGNTDEWLLAGWCAS